MMRCLKSFLKSRERIFLSHLSCSPSSQVHLCATRTSGMRREAPGKLVCMMDVRRRRDADFAFILCGLKQGLSSKPQKYM
mmetsp:Transcript_2075/g.5568  ORF Transcript_2075/g.5568 Transcript_2075/m.5568 type:complete len:80 (-) Transcript_2075:26-265(-)